jgi:hypothetical protein
MTSDEGKEHTMKHIAVVIGIAAAMGVFAPVAAGSAGKSVAKPAIGKRTLPVNSALVLQSAHNSRTGQTMYRLGNSGLWME